MPDSIDPHDPVNEPNASERPEPEEDAPRKAESSEEETPAPEPEQPGEAEEAAGGEAPGLDWRIVGLLVLAAVFLIVVYFNRRTHKPEQVSDNTQAVQPSDEAAPEQEPRQLTFRQLQAAIRRQRELGTKETLYTTGEGEFLVARPPMPRTAGSGESERRIVDIVPGALFDISNRPDDLLPTMIHRCIYGRTMLFPHLIPVINAGEAGKVKPVIRPADELTLDLLPDTERVIGVALNGEARAYPVKYMTYHQVINDVLGGEPIAVVWSVFSDAASGFKRPVTGGPVEENPLRFASSALIYQGDILAFDEETNSLWYPARCECIVGERLGETLDPVRAAVTSWQNWRRMHPDSSALVGTDPAMRFDYEQNVLPREYYREDNYVMYPIYVEDIMETPMMLKTLVFGVMTPSGESARAYARRLLSNLPEEEQTFEDTVGDMKVTVVYDGGTDMLSVTGEGGGELLVQEMIWAAWWGAHPETEVWRRGELEAQAAEWRDAEEVSAVPGEPPPGLMAPAERPQPTLPESGEGAPGMLPPSTPAQPQ